MFFPLGLLPPLLRKEVRAQAEVGLQGMDGRKGHSGEMNFYFPYNVKIKYFEPFTFACFGGNISIPSLLHSIFFQGSEGDKSTCPRCNGKVKKNNLFIYLLFLRGIQLFSRFLRLSAW